MFTLRNFSKFSLSHLTPLQLKVTQLKGTEPPFTSELLNEKSFGTYACVVCSSLLFDSTSKFDSGSGWPSFTKPIFQENLKTVEDFSHGMTRTEVLCSNCNSHLGHHFTDGPHNSRYCINGCALKFNN